MNVSRRMVMAGLPAAGATVLAALALAGGPAAAAGDTAARPVVMSSPCAAGGRTTNCTYGDDTGTPGGAPGADHTRGNGGYGSVSPTTTPPTVPGTTPPTTTTTPPGTPGTTQPGTTPPTGVVDSVPPPGNVAGTTSPPARPAPSVSETPYGGTLAVTGPPMGAVLSLGGLLVAAGAASVLYTRRRRSA